jgi:hypothetical protein
VLDFPEGKPEVTRKSGLVIAALFLAIAAVQSRIEDGWGQYRATEEILYIDNPVVLKKLLVGFENVAADLYWLRTVQYFGGKRQDAANKEFDLLEPLLRITVTLDPKFKVAYTYGATFLSEPFPRGAGMPSKGIALIDEGIRQHPEHWRFYLDKGFLYYWYLGDFRKAAEIFLEGAKIEGSPHWMRTTAGRILLEGGERQMSRALWLVIHDSAETAQQRENAAIHLRQLDALDQIDALRRLAAQLEERTGRYPESWGELIHAGLLREVPVDPTGAPYILDPVNRKVSPSRESKLGRLPPH